MGVEANLIKEALDAGLYKQTVTMYLQLLKSMTKHFVEDEHYCYFDDKYCLGALPHTPVFSMV